MSAMNQLALASYMAVMLACVAAIPVAAQQADRRGDVLHWVSGAVIFAGLAVLRIWNGEKFLRDTLRGWMRLTGEYAQRAEFQMPLALAFALLGLGVVVLFVRLWQRTRPGSRARLVLYSRFALLTLVPLYGLRLVSLHAVDRLLYSGPLRINWLLEGAIWLVVGGSATLYALRKRSRLS